MKAQTQSDLPSALIALVEGLSDRELAARLMDVLVAAARTIERLAAINLVALEPQEATEGSADLELWERMAPAVGDTIVAVNELIAVVDGAFPPLKKKTVAFGSESSDVRTEIEAAAAFRAIAPLLRHEITEVGALIQQPELLSSPWRLLGELQRLRAGMRARVGDAVFLSAGAMGAVSRDDVVPGWAQEVLRALSFRSTGATLRNTVLQRIEVAIDGGVLAENVDQDLDVFTAMPAWRHVKVETKRAMLALRTDLKDAATSGTATVDMVKMLMVPMLDVLSEAATEISRAVLRAHDRHAKEIALRRIEQAELHLVLETGASHGAVEAAFVACNPLRGANPIIDEALRSNVGVHELAESELAPLVAQLNRALQTLDA
ncbi:MAG: hypothetical protein ACO1OB_33385 [Archangium sp.]